MKITSTFNNADKIDDFEHWNGKEIEILGVIANPSDTSVLDVEAMPQFQVKLMETGETNTAYVNEIPESDWTSEMKAVLDGQKAFALGKPESAYTGAFEEYFKYGYELGEIKGLTSKEFA